MASIADTIVSTPILAAILATMLEGVIQYTRGVGPRRAILYSHIRRPVWLLLDPLARKLGRPLTRDKTGEKAEFICTVELGLLDLLTILWDAEFRWNPLSTVKVRSVNGTRQAAMSVVLYTDDGWQQDIYLFSRAGGAIDAYGHFEPDPTNPDEHTGGEHQQAGDPKGLFGEVMATNNVTFIG